MLKDILIIDNYDSFTFNLVQYLGRLGAQPRVVENDQITVEQIEKNLPEAILISPGPGTPAQAGVSRDVIATFHGRLPILGICLGHQAIGEVFGGKVVGAGEIRHGKTSIIHHNHNGLFASFSQPLTATRYHSLIVEKETLPDSLSITAWTDDGQIMGLQAGSAHTYGVQFHPESYATENGISLLENFICCQN